MTTQIAQFKPQQKVTLYIRSELSSAVNAYEIRVEEIGTKQYAQYVAVPFVIGTVKRKRRLSEFMMSFRPYMIVVDGWDNIKPNGLYDGGKEIQFDGGTIKKGLYSFASDGYQKDFDAVLDEEIAAGNINVIADYRNFEVKPRF